MTGTSHTRTVLRWSAAVIALGIAVGGTAAAMKLLTKSSPRSLDIFGVVPAFSLRDHTNNPYTNKNLQGRLVIANFVFTRCETICPVMSLKMRSIQDKTRSWSVAPLLLSITVDPTYDTPQRLHQYARRFGAETDRWRFLTGPPTAVQKIVEQGLKIAMDNLGTSSNGIPNIVHGEHFVLIDTAQQIRGYYASNDAGRIAQLLEDARHLLAK